MKKTALLTILSLLFLCSCTGDSFRDHIRRGNRYYEEAVDTTKADTALVDSTLLEDALTEYKRAISKDSTVASAHYNIGNTYLLNGNDSIAYREYHKADSLETDTIRQAHIHRNMGVLLQAQSVGADDSLKVEFLKDAVLHYKSSLRFDPHNDETRYNLTLCLWQLKKYEQQSQGGGGSGEGEDNSEEKDEQGQQQQQQEEQQRQQQEQQKQQQQQQAEEQMINDAKQREKDTQRRLNAYEQRRRQQEQQQHQNARPRKLQKNW